MTYRSCFCFKVPSQRHSFSIYILFSILCRWLTICLPKYYWLSADAGVNQTLKVCYTTPFNFFFKIFNLFGASFVDNSFMFPLGTDADNVLNQICLDMFEQPWVGPVCWIRTWGKIVCEATVRNLVKECCTKKQWCCMANECKRFVWCTYLPWRSVKICLQYLWVQHLIHPASYQVFSSNEVDTSFVQPFELAPIGPMSKKNNLRD